MQGRSERPSVRGFAVGFELRHRHNPRMFFVMLSEAFFDEYENAFGTVFCLEFLEHVFDLPDVLKSLARVTRPGGRVIVGVPVEAVLPPVLARQTSRTVLSWNGVERQTRQHAYTTGDPWKWFVEGDRQRIEPLVRVLPTFKAHDLKGVNLRLLKRLVKKLVWLERVTGTPVSWLPASLNSQVWFVGTAKP